jgi:CRP-like cAMP-binding protein
MIADRKALLARLPLFAGLSERELDEIARATRTCALAAREELFHKGDAGGDLYVIERGRLRAFATGPDGNDIVFSYQGVGEVVGELAAFVEQERSASIAAVEPSALLVLSRRDFLAVLRRHPEIAIRLLQVLARRVVRLSEVVEDTSFKPLSARLAKCLLGFAERWGEPCPGGIRIPVTLRQSELGNLIGGTLIGDDCVVGHLAHLECCGRRRVPRRRSDREAARSARGPRQRLSAQPPHGCCDAPSLREPSFLPIPAASSATGRSSEMLHSGDTSRRRC